MSTYDTFSPLSSIYQIIKASIKTTPKFNPHLAHTPSGHLYPFFRSYADKSVFYSPVIFAEQLIYFPTDRHYSLFKDDFIGNSGYD